jgi:hypothetical protein
MQVWIPAEIFDLRKKTLQLEALMRGWFRNQHGKNQQSIQSIQLLIEQIKLDMKKLLWNQTRSVVIQSQIQSSISSVNVFLQKYRQLEYYNIPLEWDLVALDIGLYINNQRNYYKNRVSQHLPN